MTIIVDHYGIHTADSGVRYLVQESGGENALGLPDPCPFEVRVKKTSCPHAFNLGLPAVRELPPLEEYQELVRTSGIARFLMPHHGRLPRIAWTRAYSRTDRRELKRLSSYVTTLVPRGVPSIPTIIWSTQMPREIVAQMRATNLTPLVIQGFRPEHTSLLSKILEIAQSATRDLLLVVDEYVPVPSSVEYLPLVDEDTLDFWNDPLAGYYQAIGTMMVRSFLREGKNIWADS